MTWRKVGSLKGIPGASVKGDAGKDGRSFEWRGEWRGGSLYLPDDVVGHDGSSWIATVETTGEPPGPAWDLVALRGEQGPPGSSGRPWVRIGGGGGGGSGTHPDLATHDALGLATDAELAAHVAAVDPHPIYLTQAEGDAAYSATGHGHSHASLSGVTANQHHNQVHAIDGADHTGQLASAQVSVLTILKWSD